MDAFLKLRNELLDLNAQVMNLIQQSEVVLGGSVSVFTQWKQACAIIERHLNEHIVRVAVVGAIKSGKSTLINALLGDDHLKRGAGVVTSIVTRIRRGPALKARLFFKSWDEINDEIEQALVLFPADQWKAGKNDYQRFDIRRKQDRLELSSALAALDAELRIAQDQLNANSVLLTSYLKGFDRIQNLVQSERNVQEFDHRQFADHRNFVGEDALAVYLRDIELEMARDTLAGNLEIADCQGSDSPNPLHMAMIQDYLLKAHLIVYVISSRTGLRQADIRFLSMIKRMGIADNILFVCNCDLNEHAGLEELKALVQRMREEISLIISEPRLFALSALLNLFAACEEKLPERDRQRLSLWRGFSRMASFSEEETTRLQDFLNRKLSRERSSLLLRNQLERLNVINNGLGQWVHLNRDLMRRDAAEARTISERVEDHQQHLLQVQAMIQSTLDGALQKIKKELRQNIDSFFDLHHGPILKNLTAYVSNYTTDLSQYEEALTTSGFTQTLYVVFQAFKQSVDGYLAEKTNPEIMGFFGRLEARLETYFKSVAEPYEKMVRNTLTQFEEALSQYGLTAVSQNRMISLSPEMENIKQLAGLALPSATASMRYSAHIKTDAVLRLGFYTLVRVIRKALKKPLSRNHAEEMRALQDGIRRMKRETERSILAHFKDYQENAKFQYMMRLADIASRKLFDSLTEHFQGYLADLKTLTSSIGTHRSDKEQVDQALEAIWRTTQTLEGQIDGLRRTVAGLQDDAQNNDGGGHGIPTPAARIDRT